MEALHVTLSQWHLLMLLIDGNMKIHFSTWNTSAGYSLLLLLTLNVYTNIKTLQLYLSINTVH